MEAVVRGSRRSSPTSIITFAPSRVGGSLVDGHFATRVGPLIGPDWNLPGRRPVLIKIGSADCVQPSPRPVGSSRCRTSMEVRS